MGAEWFGATRSSGAARCHELRLGASGEHDGLATVHELAVLDGGAHGACLDDRLEVAPLRGEPLHVVAVGDVSGCLLYTSDAADD